MSVGVARKTGEFDVRNIKKIRVSIFSPDIVRAYSYGEVKKPETINYRTLKPERDGLFCERIFGPTQDYRCHCGKFASKRYKGIVCDKCGVEVTESKVRRERMGHIDLVSPVVHIWFYKIVPSRIGLILGVGSTAELTSVIYHDGYIVIDPGDVPELKRFQIITDSDYEKYQEKYRGRFIAETGAEAIKQALEIIDLEAIEKQLRREVEESGEKADPKTIKRLDIITSLIKSGVKPEWMVIESLPVIPPELRPMVLLDGGRFASSDLNELYRKIINRNNRLRKIISLAAPEIIIKSEKRLLQDSVDALIDNSRKKNPVKSSSGKVMRSLAALLKGKQGRFRQNLLGKRVDYSGRSVIVVDPKLKLWQCGIPRRMAVELFKPFIMKELIARKYAFNIKQAKNISETYFDPRVHECLEAVINKHPVLLNRAPTLHRLSIEAFEPVLVEDSSIHLHPLVCHPYNADFDGDQMAVHVPLSPEAQVEAWVLLLSARNLLKPATGEPIMFPTQDMVLGMFFLTKSIPQDGEEKKPTRIFGSFDEVRYLWESGKLNTYDNIIFVYKGQKIETTVGRVVFNSMLHDSLRFINKNLTNKDLNNLVKECYLKCGRWETVKLLENMKEVGYYYATRRASTISLEDIKVPSQKYELINKAEMEESKVDEDFKKGFINADERFNKIISIWSHVGDKLKKEVENTLREDQKGLNPVYAMMTSGARGNREQVKQLAGMRGLMSKPSGEIIELPIKSNFKEGLGLWEYFISAHGGRKGLADTALKTSEAGYLTRKLVDIAHSVVVTEEDCGTAKGIAVSEDDEGGREGMIERIIGKTSLLDVHDPQTGEIIVKANEIIDFEKAKLIDRSGISRVMIRHVLTCESENGVCAKCYGWDLAHNKPVQIGEAVGIVAAQSIGEPGTQLTMRTFHTGGIASAIVEKSWIDFNVPVFINDISKCYVINQDGEKVTTRKGNLSVYKVLSKVSDKLSATYHVYNTNEFKKVNINDGEFKEFEEGDIIAIFNNGSELKAWEYLKAGISQGKLFITESEETLVRIPIGSVILVNEGDLVESNVPVARFDPYNEPIISEQEGVVLIEEDTTKPSAQRDKILRILDDFGNVRSVDFVPADAELRVRNGDRVKVGEILAKRSRSKRRTYDIVSGLPRVTNLFEARGIKNQSVLSKISGTVQIEIDKGKVVVVVEDDFGNRVRHKIPSGRYLYVRNGDRVTVGEELCDGEKALQGMLQVLGVEEVSKYLLNKIQSIYRDQGVKIDDKHIGIIIRQMVRKVRIVEPGDTRFILGQIVSVGEFERVNNEIIQQGGVPAKGRIIILGISRAALTSESFLSSASFQETHKVLTEAAIKGSEDYLRGLKENLIVGRPVPVGTGSPNYETIDFKRKEEEDEKIVIDFLGEGVA
ncbi:MAG: DNA-directed RNA polymerase subunit beta' [Spirochaetia bacterium]|nr:DNA-directed RNA polymerase subunit beta' [Spirochaetota bacterium]MDW8113054.1 DNA-directed RNA polymerase subunit beta' [Spirochaetia bacterium]